MDIAINHILEKGTLKQFKVRVLGFPGTLKQELILCLVTQMPERQGPTNDTRGAMVAH